MHPRRIRPRPPVLLLGLAAALAACDRSSSGPDARLTLSTADTTLEVGETAQLSARGFTSPPAWTSSDPAVATVLSTGFVTAVGPGTAQITASSGSRSASAAVHVVRPPTIALSAVAAAFSAYSGGGDAPAQSIAVSNAGDSPLTGLAAAVTYAAGGPEGWLSATLSATSAPATLVLQPQTGSLPAGIHTATVRLTAPLPRVAPASVAVTFTVAPAPVVSVSPGSAVFLATLGAGDPPPQTLQVANAAASPLTGLTATVSYGAGQLTGWLTAVLGAGAAPTTLELRARAAGLPAGMYTAAVDVGSALPGVAPRRVPVVFTVEPPPSVRLSPTSVSFGAAPGGSDPAAATVAVTNGGGGTLSGLSASTAYEAGEPAGWLTAVLDVATAPATLTLRARTAGLAEGDYTARVTVASSLPGVGPAVLLVTFTLRRTPILVVQPADVAFAADESGDDPPGAAVQVTNGGGGTLTGLSAAVAYGAGQPAGWLDASLGATAAPATLTLRAHTGSLPAGSYTATVTVSSSLPGVPSATVAVRFTVDPTPVITLSSSTANFTATVGGSNPATQTFTVSEARGDSLTGLSAEVVYKEGQPTGWLEARLSGPDAPAVLTLKAETGSLPEDTFTAAVVVRSSQRRVQEKRMTVTFQVGPAPVVVLFPKNVEFPLEPTPSNVKDLRVSNGSMSPATGLTASVQYTGVTTGWLTASLIGTAPLATLRLQVTAGPLPKGIGTYTARVVVASAVPGARPDTVLVSYKIEVSFEAQIVTRFSSCVGCHYDDSPGRDPPRGNLSLTPGSAYRELVEERSRRGDPPGYPRVTPYNTSSERTVNLLLCTLLEPPCGTMTSHSPANDLIPFLIGWIREGAPNN